MSFTGNLTIDVAVSCMCLAWVKLPPEEAARQERRRTCLSCRSSPCNFVAHLSFISVLILRCCQETRQRIQQSCQLGQELPPQQVQLAVLRRDSDSSAPCWFKVPIFVGRHHWAP